jgi:hypothetical protein
MLLWWAGSLSSMTKSEELVANLPKIARRLGSETSPQSFADLVDTVVDADLVEFSSVADERSLGVAYVLRGVTKDILRNVATDTSFEFSFERISRMCASLGKFATLTIEGREDGEALRSLLKTITEYYGSLNSIAKTLEA